MDASRSFGTIRSAADFIPVIRRRLAELSTTIEVANDVAGLADRHLNKLMCGSKGFGLISTFLVMQALGLKLIAVADDEQLAKVQPRLTKRTRPLPKRLQQAAVTQI